MINQATIENQIEFFQLMIYVAPIIGTVFFIYFAFAFIKYIKHRKHIAMYYALANLFYAISMYSLEGGILDALEHNTKTVIYLTSVMVMNITILLNSLFMFLFTTELIKISNKRRLIIVFIGILIILFHFLPQNGWFDTETSGFKLMYISFTLMALYSLIIYFIIMREFLALSKNPEIKQSRTTLIAFNAIWLAAFLMLIFFIIMLIRVGIDTAFLQITAFGILFVAMGLFFIGFTWPSLKK